MSNRYQERFEAAKARANKARTGQTGTVLVRDADGNIVSIPTNGRYGQSGPCAPMSPAQPQSWGAACPPGHCDSNSLAAAMGRAFGGERYGCRELTYWITPLELDAAGAGMQSQNATVTICPTRVIAIVKDSALAAAGEGYLSEFTIGNTNQIVGDPLPLAVLAPYSYAIIPFVPDCIRAGMPFSISVVDGPAEGFVYFGLVGPTIG
jgi:hypothetical protein